MPCNTEFLLFSLEECKQRSCYTTCAHHILLRRFSNTRTHIHQQRICTSLVFMSQSFPLLPQIASLNCRQCTITHHPHPGRCGKANNGPVECVKPRGSFEGLSEMTNISYWGVSVQQSSQVSQKATSHLKAALFCSIQNISAFFVLFYVRKVFSFHTRKLWLYDIYPFKGTVQHFAYLLSSLKLDETIDTTPMTVVIVKQRQDTVSLAQHKD